MCSLGDIGSEMVELDIFKCFMLMKIFYGVYKNCYNNYVC